MLALYESYQMDSKMIGSSLGLVTETWLIKETMHQNGMQTKTS